MADEGWIKNAADAIVEVSTAFDSHSVGLMFIFFVGVIIYQFWYIRELNQRREKDLVARFQDMDNRLKDLKTMQTQADVGRGAALAVSDVMTALIRSVPRQPP